MKNIIKILCLFNLLLFTCHYVSADDKYFRFIFIYSDKVDYSSFRILIMDSTNKVGLVPLGYYSKMGNMKIIDTSKYYNLRAVLEHGAKISAWKDTVKFKEYKERNLYYINSDSINFIIEASLWFVNDDDTLQTLYYFEKNEKFLFIKDSASFIVNFNKKEGRKAEFNQEDY